MFCYTSRKYPYRRQKRTFAASSNNILSFSVCVRSQKPNGSIKNNVFVSRLSRGCVKVQVGGCVGDVVMLLKDQMTAGWKYMIIYCGELIIFNKLDVYVCCISVFELFLTLLSMMFFFL